MIGGGGEEGGRDGEGGEGRGRERVDDRGRGRGRRKEGGWTEGGKVREGEGEGWQGGVNEMQSITPSLSLTCMRMLMGPPLSTSTTCNG
jgi:hypothetical protein